jgi:hypothetical protein
MKDEEQQLEEIEASHTLGGAGEVARGDASGRVRCYSFSRTRHTSHQGAWEKGKAVCVCVCVCEVICACRMTGCFLQP